MFWLLRQYSKSAAIWCQEQVYSQLVSETIAIVIVLSFWNSDRLQNRNQVKKIQRVHIKKNFVQFYRLYLQKMLRNLKTKKKIIFENIFLCHWAL